MADNSILREAAAGHFDVLAARKAGYSDAEIEQYLLLASGRSPRGTSKAQQTAPGEGLPPELSKMTPAEAEAVFQAQKAKAGKRKGPKAKN